VSEPGRSVTQICFEEKVEFSQAFQDLLNVVAMFGHAQGIDKDIIDVDEHKLAAAKHGASRLMCNTLKGGISRF